MAKQQKHTIKTQIIELEIVGARQEQVPELQQQFIRYFIHIIGEELERVFDKMAPPDLHIYLNELEIDLGELRLDFNLESQIKAQAKKIIEKILRQALKDRGVNIKTESEAQRLRKLTELDILETFLRTGHYPTWAAEESRSPSDIMDTFLSKKPEAVARMILSLAGDKKAFQRLLYQFPVKHLRQILQTLLRKQAPKALEQLGIVRRQLSDLHKGTTQKLERGVYEGALSYIFERKKKGKSLEYDERDFTRTLIETTQKRLSADKDQLEKITGVQTEQSAKYSDVDLIEYFLRNGSIPAWGAVGSKDSLESILEYLIQTKLVRIQEIIERNARDRDFIARLHLQFPKELVQQLVTPLGGEDWSFVERSAAQIAEHAAALSSSTRRERIADTVIQTALQYYFGQRRSRFVQQVFLERALESVAALLRSDTDTVAKTLYKGLLEKGDTAPAATELQTGLEAIDEELAKEALQERDEVREREQRRKELERELESMERKAEKADPEELALLQRRLGKIEYELELYAPGSDQALMPAEAAIAERRRLERRLRQAERRLSQAAQATEEEHQALEQERQTLRQELLRVRRRFERFSRVLIQQLEEQTEKLRLLEERLEKATDSQRRLLSKRLERSRSRLSRLQNDVKKASEQLRQDGRALELRVVELQAALRAGNLSAEQERLLRAELQSLQSQIQSIRQTLDELQNAGKERSALYVHPDEFPKEEVPIETEQEAVKTSKLDFLLAVLQFGSIPWWAEEYRKSSLQEVLLDVIQDNAAKFRQAMQQVGKNPAIWERLVKQLSETALSQVLDVLHPGMAGMMRTVVLMLERIHQAKVFASVSNAPLIYFKWSKLLEVALSRPVQSPGQFVRDVAIETAREFGLSPKELLVYLGNIARNVPETRYQVFQNILPSVEEDPALQEAEREYRKDPIDPSVDPGRGEQGAQRKLEWLVEFLQSEGKFPEPAKERGYGTVRAMERLLLEQLSLEPEALHAVLPSILLNPNVRLFVLQQLRPQIYSELLQFIDPGLSPLLEAYLRDWQRATGDRDLLLERDALLEYVLQSDETDVKQAVKYVLQSIVRRSRRQPLAVLEDWRQKLQALGSAGLKSSLLMNVLALQAEWFVSEQRREGVDAEQAKRLQEQIERVHRAYEQINQELLEVLYGESVSARGVPGGLVSVPQLLDAIRDLQSDVQELDAELQKLQPGQDPERVAELRRRRAQTQAEIELWERKKPALLRYLGPLREEMQQEMNETQKRIDEVRRSVRRLEEQAPEQPLTAPPTPLEEEASLQLSPQTALDELERWERRVEQADPTKTAWLEALEGQLRRLLPQASPTARPYYERILLRIREKREQWTLQSPESIERAVLAPVGQTGLQLKEWADFIQKNLHTAPIPELLEALERAEQLLDELIDPVQEQTLRAAWSRRRLAVEGERYARRLRQVRQWSAKMRELQTRLEQAGDEDYEALRQALEIERQNQVQLLDAWRQEARTPAERQEAERLLQNLRIGIDELAYLLYEKQRQALYAQYERLEENRLEQQRAVEELDIQENKALHSAELQRDRQARRDRDKEKTTMKLPDKKVNVPLLVRNSGLVILWPYVTRLFKLLNYSDGKVFLSEDAQIRGVLLLQYLATGQRTTPENELVLNKIMCSLPVSTPVPTTMDFTEEEIKMADGLIMGAIANWSKMKSMSPDALRGTFILRPGNIAEEADRWRLKVEKGPYDIILKTLPWGYTFVKFQWMEKFITVEWGNQ